jgi:hypothetical protein
MTKKEKDNSEFKKAFIGQFFKGGIESGMVRPQVQEALEKYFTTDGKGYTGSQFESLISDSDPYHFTERDFVALSTLNVDVPARAALWILSLEGQAQTSALLEGIPNDLDIWKPEVENAFVDDGKLMQLWDCLGKANWPVAATGGGLGGATKRSKLIAAKRPRLVPVLDKVVKNTLPKSDNYWRAFQDVLRDESCREGLAVATNLDCVPQRVSLLRRIDVVIWMNNHERHRKTKR